MDRPRYVDSSTVHKCGNKHSFFFIEGHSKCRLALFRNSNLWIGCICRDFILRFTHAFLACARKCVLSSEAMFYESDVNSMGGRTCCHCTPACLHHMHPTHLSECLNIATSTQRVDGGSRDCCHGHGPDPCSLHFIRISDKSLDTIVSKP